MHAAVRRPALLHAGFRGGDKPIRKTHAPRKLRRDAVVAIAGEQASDTSDGVTDTGRRRTDIQKLEQRNPCPARQNNQSKETAQKTAKPRETVTTDDLWPWIREEFMRIFKNMIEPRADQAGQPRDSDDEKALVSIVSGGNALELRSASVEIGL